MNVLLSEQQTEAKVRLATELEKFAEFGERTLVEYVRGIPYFINEYWTSRQRQGNRLHEVSYRACFKPQLPAFFIERLTNAGDRVYDPFMGRGTTPIEASLSGRVAVGSDINPLSQVLTEPRINPPSLRQITERISEIPWSDFVGYSNDELLAFYHPKTLEKIEGLKFWLHARDAKGELDKIDRWIRMVAINRLTGHSAGFFSVYTLPPNQAVSVKRQIAINEKRNQTPPERDVAAIIAKKSKSLLSQFVQTAAKPEFYTARSHETSQINTESIALTVTSPPFLDIVNYEADNWLRCWFIGVDPNDVKISKHKTVEDWQSFIAATLKELARITIQGGHIAFEVGEVRNGKIKLEEFVIAAASGLPLEVIGVMINRQEFTKTSNVWGVKNNKGGTNSNRIVLLRKLDDN